MRKTFAFFILLFFSLHIFEPSQFFIQQGKLLVFEDHVHPNGSGHAHSALGDNHAHHPCCMFQTVDSVIHLVTVILGSILPSTTVLIIGFAFLAFVYLKYSSRGPPQYIFSR